MNRKIKIRHKNWYWGNFIYEGQSLDNTIISLKNSDFEEYNEEEHGWHHSEEFKNGQLIPYRKEKE